MLDMLTSKVISRVAPKVTPRIVAATAVAVQSADKDRAKRIQDAMNEAVLQCSAEGVTDPAAVRARMQEARERAKNG